MSPGAVVRWDPAERPLPVAGAAIGPGSSFIPCSLGFLRPAPQGVGPSVGHGPKVTETPLTADVGSPAARAGLLFPGPESGVERSTPYHERRWHETWPLISGRRTRSSTSAVVG